MTQFLEEKSSDGRWPKQAAGRIPLIDFDPDLSAGRAVTREQSVAPVFRFRQGGIPTPDEWDTGPLGYMVLKGLVIYESGVAGRGAAELVGPGDVVRAGLPTLGLIPTHVDWIALEPTVLADLNQLDAPGLLISLAIRHADRADRSAVDRSIGSHVRVDVRVLAYLWHLGDRFGTVAPGSVKLDVGLTHAILGRLIGARRPTVTTALQRLIQLGYVALEGRNFRLMGDAGAIDDLDQRSPAHNFAYPNGDSHSYNGNGTGPK